MKASYFLGMLRSSNTPVFTLSYAARIIGKKGKYASLFLSRLAARNELIRIEKGKYCVPEASIYAIASNIAYPSYVSMLSAFRYYNITTQNIVRIDVVSARRHAAISGIKGYGIDFTVVGRNRMFGFYRDRESGAFVAYVEKALIDALLFEKLPLPYIEEALASADAGGIIDYGRLRAFTFRTGSRRLAEKLNDLCATAGVGKKPAEVFA